MESKSGTPSLYHVWRPRDDWRDAIPCASSPGYGSWWCLGGGGTNSPIRSGCEGNALGHVVADVPGGHTMPCSVLMFFPRHSFWDQALYLPGQRPLLVGGHGLGVNTLDSALTLPTRELRVSPQSRAQLDLRHLQGGWWGQTRLKQEEHHGWVHPQGGSIREQGNKGVPHPQLEQ